MALGVHEWSGWDSNLQIPNISANRLIKLNLAKADNQEGKSLFVRDGYYINYFQYPWKHLEAPGRKKKIEKNLRFGHFLLLRIQIPALFHLQHSSFTISDA